MFALIAAVSLVAGSPPPRPLQTGIRNKLDLELLDGASARFKWLPLKNSKGFYCGLLNAKNSLGAYTGFKPFLAEFDPRTLKVKRVRAWEDGKNNIVITAICGV